MLFWLLQICSPIQQYVSNKLGKSIDVLIVTHIENGHIEGMKTMLKDPDIKVGRILFNCYQRYVPGVQRKLNAYH